MMFRTLLQESSTRTRILCSHIAISGSGLKTKRCFVKFPRIFDKQKPEIVSPSTVNLHDQNTGFTNFIKTLDSLVETDQISKESLVSLFEKFELSLSDDNDHLLKVLESYQTETLVLMLDSLTFYNQTKTGKNIKILLNDLCSVLSKRDFILAESDDDYARLIVPTINITNRIKQDSKEVKLLITALNRELRRNLDLLVEKGEFTRLFSLLSYTQDPGSIYAIVHTCLNKLDRLKHTDYGNLPEFLFRFKIFEDKVIEKVVSQASSSPCSVFEYNENSFRKFVLDLRKFEPLYNNNEISFSPCTLYLKKLNTNLPLYTQEELFFMLRTMPGLRSFEKQCRKEYQDLIHQTILSTGIISEDREFKTISHLTNGQLISFIKYVNKIQSEENCQEWKNLKATLLKRENENLKKEETHGEGGENKFFNEFAKDLSSRMLTEVPQNCELKDVDETFKKLESLESLMALLNRLESWRVEELYTDSLTLCIKRILGLLSNSDYKSGELRKLFRSLPMIKFKPHTDFSMELYNLADKEDLEVLEKALRYKVQYLNKQNQLSEVSQILEDLMVFEKISKQNFKTLVSLLDLISKTSRVVNGSAKTELKGLMDKFSGMVYEELKNDISLLTDHTASILVNLGENTNLLKELDSLTERGWDQMRVPELINVFIYRIRRIGDKKEHVEKVKKLQEYLSKVLEELASKVERSFRQRILVSEGKEQNSIVKINPWMNEHGLKYLFKKPQEDLDIFLYEKCPEIDKYFKLKRHEGQFEGDNESDKGIGSLHELKMELIELNRRITKEEMDNRLKEEEGEEDVEELLRKVGSDIRRAILEVEMCRPISRDYHLPKKWVKELVKLSLKKYVEEKI